MGQDNIAKTSLRHMASTGDELSLLGFGCMRFPKKGLRIDMEASEPLIRRAIEAGVNYFDTAYMYSGSEEALGAILAKTGADGRKLRDKVNIATKLPAVMIRSREDMDDKFNTSLKRLRTDYVDYYLMHSLSSFGDWDRLKRLGALDFIDRQRAAGRIRHIGFSWHGNLSNFRRVVDDYGWGFCMIQYNYIDTHYQAGTEGLKYAAAKGLGIVIMEPLRGGTLAGNLPPRAAKIINDYKGADGKTASAAYWGLRWVMDKPEVHVVLSGMSTIGQLTENIAAAADSRPGSLSAPDAKAIDSVAAEYRSKTKVSCTGCSYCVPCPYGVDIPTCLSYYNDKAVFGGRFNDIMYLVRTGGATPGRASQCIKCGVCEKKCPQQLHIMDNLSDAAKTMEKPWLTIPVSLAMRIMGR